MLFAESKAHYDATQKGSNLVLNFFPVRTKIFLGEASLPPGYGSVDFCTS